MAQTLNRTFQENEEMIFKVSIVTVKSYCCRHKSLQFSKLKYNFVETPHKFIIAELSIYGSVDRKLCDNKLTWCFYETIF